MVNAVFLGDAPGQFDYVYVRGRRARIGALTSLYGPVIGKSGLEEHKQALSAAEVAFSTWGMPALNAEEIATYLPRLRALFYAAGTVQGFARPFLGRGITVMSAWAANAVPVAEFTVAHILLSMKGYYQNIRDCRDETKRRANQCFSGPGNFGETVALLVAGQIGRLVISLLKPFTLEVAVFDPFLSADAAAALGVKKVSLKQAFSEGMVVSNHLANNAQTRGMLDGKLFNTMRQNATFINTGRGATVVESDLIATLHARPDLTGLLDVTEPEPPLPGSPFYALPNVHLTSHIAGSLGDEVVRMADYAIAEFQRFVAGQPLQYAVTLEMLEHMA